MPPNTPIVVNRDHYDQIVADHEKIGNIASDIDDIRESIKEVADALRKCVADHETRIRALEGKQSYSSGVVAGVALMASALGGFVVALFGWLLGRV